MTRPFTNIDCGLRDNHTRGTVRFSFAQPKERLLMLRDLVTWLVILQS